MPFEVQFCLNQMVLAANKSAVHSKWKKNAAERKIFEVAGK